MPNDIIITVDTLELRAELNDSAAAEAIWQALPLSSAGNTWGDEIYFRIPVQAEGENLHDVVALGDLAFWPPGNAFCIFYGLTPASRGNEIRAASGVQMVGRIPQGAEQLRQVPSGATVTIAQPRVPLGSQAE